MEHIRELSVVEIRRLLGIATGARLRALIAQLGDDRRKGVIAAVEAARRSETLRLAESRRLKRLYHMEDVLRADGYLVVAGVDEVGRGAVAGPLTAGACVLPPAPRIEGIDDSKRLPPRRRRELAEMIKEIAVCCAVSHVPAAEVDSLGVTSALARAMGRALSALELEPDRVLVDGRPMGIARCETAVVKGDSKVAAIAAASILAKVARDDLMRDLDGDHPEYGFAINKGYGTADHLRAIAVNGASVHHRMSFIPGGGTPSLF